MTAKTNFDKFPYFDDFSDEKDFHRVLFKPSVSVQARELSQLQSIAQDQIEKFGNHVFKHGSVVIPGNSLADLSVPYVKIQATNAGLSQYVGETLVSPTGVKAVVKEAISAIGGDPITLYLGYISGGVNGVNEFEPNQVLSVEGKVGIPTLTVAIANPTGFGSIAYVNEGVYYVNGFFVRVAKQSTVISKYTTTPSCRVLLNIQESIVTTFEDESLLDPSQGSNNFAAPGADRFKISLVLTSLPLSASITEDYVELMRFENGVLKEHSRYPKYNELEKSLARRTFDEAGNFISSGFDLSVSEHLNLGKNGGLYTAESGGDLNKIAYSISPGKVYIDGFEVENIAPTNIEANKSRSTIQDAATIKPSYGQYLFITDLITGFDISSRETVSFFNTSASTGGTLIGTAKILAIDYLVGDPSTNAIYKAHISDISMNSTFTVENIGSMRVASTGAVAKVCSQLNLQSPTGIFNKDDIVSYSTIREATVAYYDTILGQLYVHKNNDTKEAPKFGDTITKSGASAVVMDKNVLVSVGQSGVLFRLPRSATSVLRNEDGNFDISYQVYRKFTIPTGATSTTAISSGTIVPLEVGTFIAVGASGSTPYPVSQFSLTSNGTIITKSSPATEPLTIYAIVNVVGGSPRQKSQTAQTDTKPSATTVTLNRADVFKIVSITNNGNNVTNKFELRTNQTDYSYELSSIVLKAGETLPSGNLVISYNYFAHGTGDFFSVDSYTTLGPDYINKIPNYYSSSSGQSYELRDVLDFRSSPGSSSGLVAHETILSTSVRRFVPRIDSLVIDKTGTISVLTGVPSDTPTVPDIPAGNYELYRVFVPAYTFSIGDVRTNRTGISAYRMKDVNKIEKRLDRLEQFTTLSLAESQFMSTEIIDSSGLNKFKTGYVVENMTNPFGLADFNSDSFSSTLGKEGFFAKSEVTEVKMDFYTVDGDNYRAQNGFLTLNYKETEFASQPYSSRITNLNPFNIISWRGNLILTPPADDWIDRIDKPSIINNITNTVIETYDVVVPFNSPPPPPEPPFTPPEPVITLGSSGGGFVIGPGGGNQTPNDPEFFGTLLGTTSASAVTFTGVIGAFSADMVFLPDGTSLNASTIELQANTLINTDRAGLGNLLQDLFQSGLDVVQISSITGFSAPFTQQIIAGNIGFNGGVDGSGRIETDIPLTGNSIAFLPNNPTGFAPVPQEVFIDTTPVQPEPPAVIGPPEPINPFLFSFFSPNELNDNITPTFVPPQQGLFSIGGFVPQETVLFDPLGGLNINSFGFDQFGTFFA